MKVIFLKDVQKVGHKGDIKEVSDGYARNFLIANNFAVVATLESIKKTEEEMNNKKAKKEHAHEEFHALRTVLMERGIKIKKSADEKGKLYAAVSPKDIIEALNSLDFPIPEKLDENSIQIDKPIKTSGVYEVKIKFGDEEIKLKLEVGNVKE